VRNEARRRRNNWERRNNSINEEYMPPIQSNYSMHDGLILQTEVRARERNMRKFAKKNSLSPP
jgi:hypothetical protein